MRLGFKKKKNSIVLSKLGIIYISLIVVMNIVGVGYGSWQNGIEYQSIITTGSIDPVFVECSIEEKNDSRDRRHHDTTEFISDMADENYINEEINEEKLSNNGNDKPDINEVEASYIELSDDKKQMNVFIKNAYSGYSAEIRYRIENQGTIPITCKVSCETVEYIKVDIEEPEGTIYGFGDSREGVITIELEKGIEKVIRQSQMELEGRNEEQEPNTEEVLGEEAEETEDYGFTIDLVFEQYNISD